VAGPGVRDESFAAALQAGLAEAELPFEIGTLRCTDDPLVIARGCLIHAELEQQAARVQHQAA